MLANDHARLPWNDAPARAYRGFAESVSPELRGFLPAEIACFADREVPDRDVRAFLDEVPAQLTSELRRRLSRLEAMQRVIGIDETALLRFLTARRHLQPWVLVYSRDGGLSDDARVVPCSSMINHGVAWREGVDGSTSTWLATARKRSSPWDFDSDLGHESAHAAFAHVPLFAQGVQTLAQSSSLSTVGSIGELSAGHCARLCYFFVELAVVVVRGERRDGESGLPVVTPQELFALLALADELMPSIGFDRALASALRCGGRYDVARDDDVYLLLEPVMAVVEKISSVSANRVPPGAEWFRGLA